MHHHSSSSGLGRKTSRRRFTKAAVLAPAIGALAATAWYTHPLLTQAQAAHPTALQQAQSTLGSWSLTTPLPAARYLHTATLLPNGQVLVTGGYDSSHIQATPYLYDPATATWTPTSSMRTPRAWHTATLLPNGQVLVVGGAGSNSILASAELYDPTTGTWTQTGSLQTPRLSYTATLLPNGKILVAGGWVASTSPGQNDPTPTAELYDPVTATWMPTGSMHTPRGDHAATLLPNGQVLVAGGYACGITDTAELYDPTTGTWTLTDSMQEARRNPKATLLNTGKVLVAGNSKSPLAEAELYDPATGIWTLTGSFNTHRLQSIVTLLSNGQVLVADELGTSSELYDPGTNTWTLTGMHTARFDDTATLLPNGQVLVVGGATPTSDTDRHPVSQASAELFNPNADGQPAGRLGGHGRGALADAPSCRWHLGWSL